jgi:hypothetical protein
VTVNTTPRSATTVHKRMRRQLLARAQLDGITHCPRCRIELDYDNGQAPNGAQADEIIPFALTGITSANLEDWQVLCARCNQSKGASVAPRPSARELYPHSREW